MTVTRVFSCIHSPEDKPNEKLVPTQLFCIFRTLNDYFRENVYSFMGCGHLDIEPTRIEQISFRLAELIISERVSNISM